MIKTGAGLHFTPQVIAGLAVLAALLAAGYWVSLRLRPYTVCRRCRGEGTIRGIVFTRARAFCAECGGTGLVPRLGTILLAPEHRPDHPQRNGAALGGGSHDEGDDGERVHHGRGLGPWR